MNLTTTNSEPIIAAHPFGHEHEIDEIALLALFNDKKTWEERYRQLILLSRQLPLLTAELRQQQVEIKGCENRLWLGHQLLADGRLHFYGDSEGRIMKGLLAVLLTAIEGLTPSQIIAQDPLTLFAKLNIRQQLSTSQVSGLQALADAIKRTASEYTT